MKIVFLCNKSEITRERKGYYDALKTFCDIKTLDHFANDSESTIEAINEYNPDACIFGDINEIPRYLSHLKGIKVGFHIDTFTALKHRLTYANLFDLNVVFHPGFEEVFSEISSAISLPHAIGMESFVKVGTEREFDVAFVGDISRPNYSVRKDVVSKATEHFKINDFGKFYNWNEMMDLYSRSSIVINVPRNDYLKDANLRCFEAIASGALLMTILPSELEAIGFVEGEHFIGFKDSDDFVTKAKAVLSNKERLNKIAASGQAFVKEFHTYHNRAMCLLSAIRELKKIKKNRLSRETETEIYLRYYSKKNQILDTYQEFLLMSKISFYKALIYFPYVAKPVLAKLKHKVKKSNWN